MSTSLPARQYRDLLLAPEEAEMLADMEEQLGRLIPTFIHVGTLLARIRDLRLWRSNYPDFSSYCRDRWGLGWRTAKHTIESAATAQSILAAGLPAPENEGLARELADLPLEERAEVWLQCRDRAEAEGKRLTAKLIAQFAAEWRKANLPSPEATPRRHVIPSADGTGVVEPRESPAYRKAMDKLTAVIEEERENGWKECSLEVILGDLRVMLKAIESWV